MNGVWTCRKLRGLLLGDDCHFLRTCLDDAFLYLPLILRGISMLGDQFEQAQAPDTDAVAEPRGDGVPQWRHSETLCETG
jgi:hypothetical protein